MRTHESRTTPRWVFPVLALALGTWALSANAKTTATTSAGDWTAITWDNGAPADGDTVVINHAVTLTNSTPSLDVFSNNATLTSVGWNTVISSRVVTVNATITHTSQTATATNNLGVWVPDSRIYIVCSNLTVNAAKAIDANGKGYQGPAGNNPGNKGRGPGASTAAPYRGIGGSFGGTGSQGDGNGIGPTYGDGDIYGTRALPVHPGSSGSGGAEGGGFAGNGGGAIFIQAAGAIVVHGAIQANGSAPTVTGASGGGSGGAIAIQCATIAGTGSITVDGGRAGQTLSGGGGGGRLAIVVSDTVAQNLLAPSLFITSYANPADGQNGITPQRGSLYLALPSDSVLYRPFVATNKPLRGVVYGLQSISVAGNLAISNEWLELAEPGVNLAVSGDVSVNAGLLRLGSPVMGSAFALTCNNLTITNSAACRLFASGVTPDSGVTNQAAPVYGGQVTASGALVVGSGCTLYPHSHPTNGGSVILSVGSALISGTVNANTNGFRGGAASAADRNGYGPGRGKATADWQWAGGGYGGAGFVSGGSGGATYGVSNAPVAPGSGGCANTGGGGDRGAAGGGLVRIHSDGAITVTGTLTANGENAVNRGSAGSGGAIYITCRQFTGSGTFNAKGGTGGGTDKPDGGGGRIAIAGFSVNTNSATFSVAKGTAGGVGAADGTLSVTLIPAVGSVVTIR